MRNRRAQNPVLAVSVLHCPIRTMGKSRTNRHIPASAGSPRPRFGGLVHVNTGRVSPHGRQRFPAILEDNSIHPSGSKGEPEESYGWGPAAAEVSCSSHWNDWWMRFAGEERTEKQFHKNKNLELSKVRSRKNRISNENNKCLWSHDLKNHIWI